MNRYKKGEPDDVQTHPFVLPADAFVVCRHIRRAFCLPVCRILCYFAYCFTRRRLLMKRTLYLLLLLLLLGLSVGCSFRPSSSDAAVSSGYIPVDSALYLPLRALDAFHQAVRLHRANDEHALLGEAYDHMGSLFMEQQLLDEALDMKQKSLFYYGLQKDTVGASYVHRDLGRIHIARHDTVRAKENFEQAYRLIIEVGTPQQANEIAGETGCFYARYAKHEQGRFLLFLVTPNTPEVTLGLGGLFKDMNMPDSALVNWHRTLLHGNLFQRRTASKELMLLYRDLGRESEARMHEVQYRLLEDSVRHISSPDTIARTHLLLSYQSAEMENLRLELENHTYRTRMYLLLAALLLVTMLALTFLQWLRRKKRLAIEQERRLRIFQERRYEESLASIQENEAKLRELEDKLAEAGDREDGLARQLLLSQQELLKATNRKNIASMTNREWQEQAFRQSEVYIRFHRAAHEEGRLSSEDWQMLQDAIDAVYPHFTTRLYELCPQLTPQEMQICCLTKISMANKYIARLMLCQPSTVTHARKRLCKKLTGTEGTTEKLIQFIADL